MCTGWQKVCVLLPQTWRGKKKTAKFTNGSIWKPSFHLMAWSTWRSTCLSLRRWEYLAEKKKGGPKQEERVFCNCCPRRKDTFSFWDLMFINRCLPLTQTEKPEVAILRWSVSLHRCKHRTEHKLDIRDLCRTNDHLQVICRQNDHL